MLIQKALAVAVKAPACHNRPTTRHNACYAVGGKGYVLQAHTSMNGKVVYTLFSLLNECIAENFPAEFADIAAHFFKRLIERHGANGGGRVTQNPIPNIMDITAGRQIHNRVCTPANRPDQFFNFMCG